MTNEELLLPRYKVIALWPSCYAKIGDIKECAEHEFGDVNYYKQWPHLFRRLEWWEDRKPEDLPKYVKCKYPVWEYKKGDVFKVTNWYIIDEKKVTIKHQTFFVSNFIPATESEYKSKIK